ncbi:hypothetical protein [Hymenobacter psychrotolerans]|uniref:Uncharacterized protein n=1 Tax=Hymenobacter psychrotolerans DSM 18569 TaxID=1121959 RepID=A0A1M7DRJ2_9BACT|nr:hypothetical protein [Hymenobacter psychrotolerans]SHL82018.1 hypothetical protein SAMN02746009_03438 [Hymenobacter psychrotolerans DSM 18569]
MKTTLFFAAALVAATTAQAQLSPTTPQRGGSLNQTTVPPAAPSNPGTLDQRTPTSTNPTQIGIGTSPTQITTGAGTGTSVGQPMQRPATMEERMINQNSAPVRRADAPNAPRTNPNSRRTNTQSTTIPAQR